MDGEIGIELFGNGMSLRSLGGAAAIACSFRFLFAGFS